MVERQAYTAGPTAKSTVDAGSIPVEVDIFFLDFFSFHDMKYKIT